jgi:LPXTG-motif cell wall-anchored protein
LFPVTGGIAQGNATIKEPSSGWTNPRLKAVFDTPRRWGSDAVKPKKSHTGAIAGGVVGGILGLCLIAGGLYFFKRRRDKARQPVELEGGDNQARPRPGELHEEITKTELAVNEKDPAELPAPDPVELHAPREAHEADQNMATRTDAAELPGTNVAAGALPGVPHVRTPGDDLPEPPLYSPGLMRRGSRARSVRSGNENLEAGNAPGLVESEKVSQAEEAREADEQKEQKEQKSEIEKTSPPSGS